MSDEKPRPLSGQSNPFQRCPLPLVSTAPDAIRQFEREGQLQFRLLTPPASGTGAKGATGSTGVTGNTGQQGIAGPGLPAGGAVGDLIKKKSVTDYDTEWFTPTYPSAGSATPQMNGAGAAGTAVAVSHEDHVHPSDTSRLATSVIASRSGNTTVAATADAGAKTTGHLATWDASGNLTDGGVVPGSTDTPSIVARISLTGKTADFTDETLYAIPAGKTGTYRISMTLICTAKTGTVTGPNLTVKWTEPDTSTVETSGTLVDFATVPVAGTPGTTGTTVGKLTFPAVLRAKESTSITVSAASVTGTITYNVYAIVEYLG